MVKNVWHKKDFLVMKCSDRTSLWLLHDILWSWIVEGILSDKLDTGDGKTQNLKKTKSIAYRASYKAYKRMRHYGSNNIKALHSKYIQSTLYPEMVSKGSLFVFNWSLGRLFSILELEFQFLTLQPSRLLNWKSN